jgi:hypothetical protein
MVVRWYACEACDELPQCLCAVPARSESIPITCTLSPTQKPDWYEIQNLHIKGNQILNLDAKD